MLRICRLFLTFVFVAVGVAGCGQASLTLTNGQTKAISDYNGRWLVINYWAEWCKPCVEEIPHLNSLNEREDTVVLGINFDGIQGSELMQQAETLGIQYDMIADDPSESLAIKRPSVLPATVLIDETGEVRDMLYGPQTVESILAKMALLE